MFFLGLIKPVTENMTMSVNVKSFRSSPTPCWSHIGGRAEEMICLSTDVCSRLLNMRLPEEGCFVLG
jgi:hypothetical protein